MGAEQYKEHHDQMLEEEIPIEDRFDWQTTKALCVGDVRKHKAYGMNIEEYAKNRRSYMDSDDTERHRLSYYLPKFPAMLTLDMANSIDMSTHRFMILLIELGLINFQVDYHSKYQIAKKHRRDIHKQVRTQKAKTYYMQLDKQTISLSTGSGHRNGISKHFSPSVPLWLYDAVTEVAANLNMSISDLVYICWCIGVSKTMPNDCVCKMLDEEINTIMDIFITEFEIYIKRISDIACELNVSG